MALTKTVSSTLSTAKDLDIIAFLDSQNDIGVKTSSLIKNALRMYMQNATDNRTINSQAQQMPAINTVNPTVTKDVEPVDNVVEPTAKQEIATDLEEKGTVLVKDKVDLKASKKVSTNFANTIIKQ